MNIHPRTGNTRCVSANRVTLGRSLTCVQRDTHVAVSSRTIPIHDQTVAYATAFAYANSNHLPLAHPTTSSSPMARAKCTNWGLSPEILFDAAFAEGLNWRSPHSMEPAGPAVVGNATRSWARNEDNICDHLATRSALPASLPVPYTRSELTFTSADQERPLTMPISSTARSEGTSFCPPNSEQVRSFHQCNTCGEQFFNTQEVRWEHHDIRFYVTR